MRGFGCNRICWAAIHTVSINGFLTPNRTSDSYLYIRLLANHPYFQLCVVGASKRSAGQSYRTAARWKQDQPMSKELGTLTVQECVPEAFKDCDIVFSGLDSDVGGDRGPLSAPVHTFGC